jgi:hypothetical protein
MRTEITSWTQSPMNEKRWFGQTKCGHGVWVTKDRKPTRKTTGCHICDKTKVTDQHSAHGGEK